MRIRKQAPALSLLVIAGVAALFTIPGEAKQPVATATVAPQTTYGALADPHIASALTIVLPASVGSF